MAAITIKNVPEPLYEQVKLSARLHRRSINNEIIACLERELAVSPVTVETRLERARALRAEGAADTTAEDIAQAIREGRP